MVTVAAAEAYGHIESITIPESAVQNQAVQAQVKIKNNGTAPGIIYGAIENLYGNPGAITVTWAPTDYLIEPDEQVFLGYIVSTNVGAILTFNISITFAVPGTYVLRVKGLHERSDAALIQDESVEKNGITVSGVPTDGGGIPSWVWLAVGAIAVVGIAAYALTK